MSKFLNNRLVRERLFLNEQRTNDDILKAFCGDECVDTIKPLEDFKRYVEGRNEFEGLDADDEMYALGLSDIEDQEIAQIKLEARDIVKADYLAKKREVCGDSPTCPDDELIEEAFDDYLEMTSIWAFSMW